MGRESIVSNNIVYGVVIKLPRAPHWAVLIERLRNFEHDSSLFAKAARAVSDKELEDVPEHTSKSARVVRSILVSSLDVNAMTEEECRLGDDRHDMYRNLRSLGEGKVAESALNKILGEGHGLELKTYTGESYSGDEDESALVLEHAESRFLDDNHFRPGVATTSLTMSVPEKKEEIDQNIRRAMRDLGLEGNDPGWQLVTTHSVYE